MTARSHERGHEIVYKDGWVDADTGEPVSDERPCKMCGSPPTPEGHDACLGHMPGVKSACCGHGCEPGYAIGEDGSLDLIQVMPREEYEKRVAWLQEMLE